MKNTKFSPAKIRSASYDADANTIDITWSVGADVLREDYEGPFIERLLMGEGNVRLDRLNSGAPFLGVHKSDSLDDVIGVVVAGSARIEDGKGLATIKLSSAAGDSDTISKIREGVIKNISVGYLIHSSTRIEGENGEPDVVEISDWEPLEVSAVPIPADAGAQIRSAGRKRPSQRLSPMQRGAAEATRLLQATRTSAEAKGASEARAVLGSIGRMTPVPKVGKIDKREVEAGAREARALLKGRRA
ncbi:hypothetical protein CWB41_04645 [Methylovirgula ligni]|uniref:HK97 family phage prohead protease n=1 Tax=Methylovirgula ligni TaxID=569860 RepID=A0A3D9ZDR9_9HYPH|nr:HK97 family phage prohead protease [Methylovirgula ligni]QAY95103.1 hypothetical protein CWB41_04645 [Methylovirgula ligni]REF89616.1 HK97 family phage prohead protease [Methylovirgula ligni]